MTNFVLVLADDMRSDIFGAMPLTRNFCQKIADGFVANPVCGPSRVSTLTGTFSGTNEIWSNGPPYGGYAKWRDAGGEADTIAVALQGAGYRTALMGKYVNGFDVEDIAQVPPGWSDWLAIATGGAAYYGAEFSQDGVPFTQPEGTYLTDFLAERAWRFIMETAPTRQPFLLVVTPTAPHSEHVPAPRHAEAFSTMAPYRPPSFNAVGEGVPGWYRNQPSLKAGDIEDIDAVRLAMHRCLLSLDGLVGSIMQALMLTGADRDTMLWFASDNGFMLGEHRLYGKSVPYLEATRMPVAVRMGGVPAPIVGAGVGRPLVQNIDWAPTCAELAGVRLPKVGGLSLVSELQGSRGVVPMLYIESPQMGGQPGFVQAQSRMRTYTRHSTGEEEWYHLGEDPYQMKNRIETGGEALESARRFVGARSEEASPPGFEGEVAS